MKHKHTFANKLAREKKFTKKIGMLMWEREQQDA